MNNHFDPGGPPPVVPPYAAPHNAPVPPKRGMPWWAIVLMCTAGASVIVPILLVLTIYGVRKYIVNAKTAEARATVGEIARRAAEQYDRVDDAGRHRMCPSASHPVPADARSVKNRKYQSTESDWKVDVETNSGFACLAGFWMTEPQYYSYNYEATARDFSASAAGDLNGDGVTSSFLLAGAVDASDAVRLAPAIVEIQPEE